jgi:3',5'-cyclic AMP phosphodiesterase CpdA
MTFFPQVRVIHISDIHFGDDHICRHAERTAADAGIPKLWELIAADLKSQDWNEFRWAAPSSEREVSPLLLVLSGDLAHTAHNEEFRSALAFVKGLLSEPLLGKTVPL